MLPKPSQVVLSLKLNQILLPSEPKQLVYLHAPKYVDLLPKPNRAFLSPQPKRVVCHLHLNKWMCSLNLTQLQLKIENTFSRYLKIFPFTKSTNTKSSKTSDLVQDTNSTCSCQSPLQDPFIFFIISFVHLHSTSPDFLKALWQNASQISTQMVLQVRLSLHVDSHPHSQEIYHVFSEAHCFAGRLKYPMAKNRPPVFMIPYVGR